MNKSILIRIIAFIVLIGVGASAYIIWWLPRQQAGPQSASLAPVQYLTEQVRKEERAASILATGAVRSRQTAALVWQTGGTVSQVNALNGQMVAAKTVLATLERTSLPQAVILAQAELVTAQKNLDTLLQSTQARANTQLALVKAEKALDDAQDDRRSLLYQRASPETIDITRARLIQADDALDQAEAFFDGHSGDTNSLVYASALSQLAKARQNQIRAQYNLNYVEGLPDPLDIEEAEAKIAVAEANVLQARLDWERVKDGPNEDDVAAAEARVDAAQATINLARISAPFSGTLTLANSKAGDQITPGTLAFQLDDLSHLYLDVAVSEDDLQRMQVGQPVQVSLDALPGKEYAGVVTEIGAVGKTTAGAVNFTVTVEISQPDAQIKPGMTASASITVGQARSLLLVPTRAIRTQGGQRVVYLLKGGTPIPVAVLTGAAVNTDTMITAGEVKEGDMVVVNPSSAPAASSGIQGRAERSSGAVPAAPPAWTAIPIRTAIAAEDEIAPTAAPLPTVTVSANTASNADAVATADAVEAARGYFAALEAGDFETAASFYSSFSLKLGGLTRSEAALALQAEMASGSRWSALEVKDSREFSSHTVLVHVAYQKETKDAKTGQASQAQVDELWPVRQENGQWRYNLGNLIDYRVLDVAEQTTAGLTVKPRQITRYSDRIRLALMVQNRTNEPIVLGQVNEILAAFTFQGQSFEAEKQQLIFDRLRSYPDVPVEVKGLFETYPDGIIIRQWKNLKVAPWFTFKLTDK